MGRNRTGHSRRAVTAFFDDGLAARQAADDLAAAGVARDRVTLVDGQDAAPAPSPHRGLWDTLKDLFMAEEDRHTYREGLRRGGCLLSVMARGDEAKIVEIMDREGAVDMDARESDWQLEGWDPVRAAADLDALASGRPDPAIAPASEAVRAAVTPAAAVGPALAPGEPRSSPGQKAVRDLEAEGLRLRTYVESQDRPDALR